MVMELSALVMIPVKLDISVTVKPTEPKITLTATPAQQIAGGKVTVDCTVKNPHDAAFSDSLPDASLTYRIGSGAEQALTGDGFNIPAGTAVGTVITITASTAAVDGKYTAATRTATATVTDKTFVTISGVRAQDGIYNAGVAVRVIFGSVGFTVTLVSTFAGVL